MSAEQIIVKDAPLEVQVSIFGKQVVQHFSTPREYVAFPARQAAALASQMLISAVQADEDSAKQVIDILMAMMDAIYEIRGDLKPAGGAVKHELIERHRRTLTKRLEVVLNSKREQKTTPNHKLSKQLVDIMLHEVFT